MNDFSEKKSDCEFFEDARRPNKTSGQITASGPQTSVKASATRPPPFIILKNCSTYDKYVSLLILVFNDNERVDACVK